MKTIVNALMKIQLFFAICFLVVFVFAVILQVATRYIPGFSWLWTEQIANYCFIWSIMMGVAIGVKNKQHFFLSILTEKLKGKTAITASIFVQSIIFIFSVFLVYYGTALTRSFWNWSLTSLPQVRQGYFWMALPVCGATITIYSINNLLELIMNKKGAGATIKEGGQA